MKKILARKYTLVSLIIIVPVGFYSKIYSGAFNEWINNSLGGFFYVIFWCLVVRLFSGYRNSFYISVIVLTVTCLLEFLQLWHPSFLEWLRSCFIGQTILGTTFNWYDFIYYILGAISAKFIIDIILKYESA
jgi:hypothetical protein